MKKVCEDLKSKNKTAFYYEALYIYLKAINNMKKHESTNSREFFNQPDQFYTISLRNTEIM